MLLLASKKIFCSLLPIQEVRIPSAGKKGVSKNPCQMKDDTSESLKDKQVTLLSSPKSCDECYPKSRNTKEQKE